MLESNLMNITMFFAIAGIGLVFVVMWIVRSESRINICKQEIKRLKSELSASDSEKFMLAEKLSALEGANDEPRSAAGRVPEELARKNKELESENKRLKTELAEAKKSVEEVYDALTSKK